MTNKRRRAFRILLTIAGLGGVAVALCLALALSALSGGPSRTGYDLLAIAMQALPYLAAVAAMTVIVGSTGTRVRFAVGGLALASGVLGSVAAGLVGLGSTLAGIEPRNQPVEVNSLLLAVWGVGGQVAPAALVLAGGAAVLAVGTWIVRRAAAGPAALEAAAI